jgi:hypothetical protein
MGLVYACFFFTLKVGSFFRGVTQAYLDAIVTKGVPRFGMGFHFFTGESVSYNGTFMSIAWPSKDTMSYHQIKAWSEQTGKLLCR